MKTIDITGLKGDYEVSAQQMLKNGELWLERHPQERMALVQECFDDEGGLFMPKSEAGKELEYAIIRDVYVPMPTMVPLVTIHVLQIAKMGRERWLRQFPKDRLFEFDGHEESVPMRD